MFDEPTDDPSEHASSPTARAKEKSDEFRMHAELAAVFEGPRKFDAELRPGLEAQIARDAQRTMSQLERARLAEGPLLPEPSFPDADRLLNLYAAHNLTTNDYHIHRRPGEVMMLRWLEGAQVDAFYERLQAHFDAALAGFKEDEHQALEWKQDPQTLEYLTALDAVEVKMADRYLRDVLRQHNVFVLSTQTADEMNIAYLAETIMSVSVPELVGPASAPDDTEAPTDRDLAWFFKLFSLRGSIEGTERMCFFAYLQKSDEAF